MQLLLTVQVPLKHAATALPDEPATQEPVQLPLLAVAGQLQLLALAAAVGWAVQSAQWHPHTEHNEMSVGSGKAMQQSCTLQQRQL